MSSSVPPLTISTFMSLNFEKVAFSSSVQCIVQGSTRCIMLFCCFCTVFPIDVFVSPIILYTLSEAWSGVNWPDLMAAQGAFGTDFYDIFMTFS